MLIALAMQKLSMVKLHYGGVVVLHYVQQGARLAPTKFHDSSGYHMTWGLLVFGGICECPIVGLDNGVQVLANLVTRSSMTDKS